MKSVIYIKQFLLTISIMHAGLSYAETLPMEMTLRAAPKENWSFEFKNKYGENIIVGIRYADEKREQINTAKLLKNSEVIRIGKVNTYRKIEISIWTQGQFGENPENAHTKKPKFTYTVDAGGNTVFVALDQNGTLYPQRGELLGFTGKTESGLSKSKNVQKKDISLNAAVAIRMQK